LVILTEASFALQAQVNKWTRQHGRYFISADARGLFSYSFVDLGEKFCVEDQNGDQCKEVIISYVDRETGNVLTLEDAFHGFEDGDHVTFSEVKGMAELNDIKPLKITVVSKFTNLDTLLLISYNFRAEHFQHWRNPGQLFRVH
jgi:ubiquitin-activating enzyme E1